MHAQKHAHYKINKINHVNYVEFIDTIFSLSFNFNDKNIKKRHVNSGIIIAKAFFEQQVFLKSKCNSENIFLKGISRL